MRPLCCNCGRTIRRLFCDVAFGQDHVVRGRGYKLFKEFPDSVEEVQRLTGVATVLRVKWVTDVERWIKHAVVWDGEYADQYFCGQGCAQRFGYHQAALGATTEKHTEAVLRQRAKLDKDLLRSRRKARRAA
jgi:hypothetical protein